MPEKPTVIFDGDCSFCRFCVDQGRAETGRQVDYSPSGEVGLTSVQFVDRDGQTYRGARAVAKTLEYSRTYRWFPWAYKNVPGFAALTEWGYRWVAANRNGVWRVVKLFLRRRG